MKKSEIKNLTDEQLIVEYVLTYSMYDTNYLLDRGTERLAKHLRDLESELMKRNILSPASIQKLNM